MNIIIAFPKLEDAKKIRNLLLKYGFETIAICNKGADVVSNVNKLDKGIVISGYKLLDMHYSELFGYLPDNFKVLLVGSAARFEDVAVNVNWIPTPIKVQELINVLNSLQEIVLKQYSRKQEKSKGRSEEDKQLILKAKKLLMDKNGLTEDEAHRYIQKMSMDSGSNIVETSQKVLILYG